MSNSAAQRITFVHDPPYNDNTHTHHAMPAQSNIISDCYL